MRFIVVTHTKRNRRAARCFPARDEAGTILFFVSRSAAWEWVADNPPGFCPVTQERLYRVVIEENSKFAQKVLARAKGGA